ncbi:unnamed protein product [Rhizoctonia solani]|uniref:Ricin B lectin domain-containing protein n=1 Tax=Rhizoctonia solani TaxID=456999 RepID=A0A8H2XD05_9AGAM|nr:unnamed protein product [Rhizoctonia solani]
MASIEPGTYRIVNLARNKVLRVPSECPDTIASWHAQDEPNQKWFIQRTGGGYRFKNCGHGKYLSVHGTQCNSRAYHGSPTTWKIIPQTPGGYLIQLEEVDRVLDLHDRGEVYIWPTNNAEPQKIWKLEKLGRATGEELGDTKDTPTSSQVGDTPATSQSVLRDEGLVDKPPPPLSPLAIRDDQIAQQSRQIQSLQRRLSEKEQAIERLREELAIVRSQESSQITALRERTRQLEELVEKVSIVKCLVEVIGDLIYAWEVIRTGIKET